MPLLDTRHKKKSFTLTTILLSVLLLLLFYIGLTYLEPPPESGITVNFGTMEFGMGDEQPTEPIRQRQAEPVVEESEEEVLPEETEALPAEALPEETPEEVVSEQVPEEPVLTQEEEETIPLPGQAPNTLNMSLFYDSPKWYFRVSANYNDTYLHTLGADPDLDEYYASQWRVDLNGYYQVNKTLQIFADVRNVTNAPLRYYLGAPENRRILLTEFYSFWARVGARLQF